jgi:hypothetical protein
LNLRKTGDSLGKSDSPSPIASLKSGEALHGLDSVVESWVKLPAALKAAILAIVNSTFPAVPPSAMGNQQKTAEKTKENIW